ncbi:MAG: Crp/Fnr family transcriptional regulator [Anaerolineaceae bacterium]
MAAISSSLPPQSHKRLEANLSQIEYFNSLPAEARNSLMEVALSRHYLAGQVIYLEGEPAEYVFILEKGWVKATRMTPEGREQGLLFLRPIEIFGDIAVFTGTTYPGTVTALEDVDAWLIPSEILLPLVKQYPDLAMAIIHKLSERVLHYIGLVEDLSLRSVESRLANSLIRNGEFQKGQIVVPRRDWTTFDEMAVRLGTVRDVLSRAMKTLEEEGFIKVEKQTIIILDLKGLSERAGR